MQGWYGLRVLWWLGGRDGNLPQRWLRQGGFDRFGPEEPKPHRRKRTPPRFEFLGGVALALAGLVVALISIFSLSMMGYFLWRMIVIDNLFHQL